MRPTRSHALLTGILLVAMALAYEAWLNIAGIRAISQHWWNETIRSVLEHPFFHIGSLPITPTLILEVVLFVLVLSFISGRIRALLQNRILTRTHLDPGQRYASAEALADDLERWLKGEVV